MAKAAMVTDPVCRMTLEPAAAAASFDYEGRRFYFCSEACKRRFVEDPNSHATEAWSPHRGGGSRGAVSRALGPLRRSPVALGVSAGIGFLATAILRRFYFGVLTLVSDWSFALQQFREFWPFVVALAVGFGIQVGSVPERSFTWKLKD